MPVPQALRGCTALPHVGPHPGIPVLAAAVAAAVLAGAQAGGLPAALGGALLMGGVLGAILLGGAAGRARLSDALVRQERVRTLLQAWRDSAEGHDDDPWTISIRDLRKEHTIPGAGPILLVQETPGAPAPPPHMAAMVADALTVAGRLRLPTSLRTVSVRPSTALSAHARLQARALLDPSG